MAVQFLNALFEQAFIKSARSTALYPLGWIFVFSGGLLATCVGFKADEWLTIWAARMVGAAFIANLGAYVYFAWRDPDALRSEKFKLTRMVIERSAKGDDLTGLIEDERQTLRISPPESIGGTD